MKEGPPKKHEPLRGADTISHELGNVLRDAVKKFTEVYKIRQAAGYDAMPSTGVDGNFALRMQYGQLREEIKRLQKRHKDGEVLEVDDYAALRKKQIALNRSYERVKQFAAEHNISITSDSDETEVAENSAANTARTTVGGEESPLANTEDASIEDTMKTPERITKPQMAEDMYESGQTNWEYALTEQQVTTNETDPTVATSPAPAAEVEPEATPVIETDIPPAPEAKPATSEASTSKVEQPTPATSEANENISTGFKTESESATASAPEAQPQTSPAPKTESSPPPTPAAETMTNEIPALSPEVKESLLKTLHTYTADIEAFRHRLTDQAVDGHLMYEEFNKRVKKLQTVLDGSQKESESIVTHIVKTEQPRVEALYSELKTDLTNQRARFEKNVGSQMAAVRDAMGQAPEASTQKETAPKRTGWFDEEYVRSRSFGDSKNVTNETESTTASTPEETITDPAESEPTEVVPTPDTPEPSTARPETKAEESAKILGLELPPSGPTGASAAFVLREEVGRLLLVADKKATPEQRGALHKAWSIIYPLSVGNGLSSYQREKLLELAPSLPEVDMKTGNIKNPWFRLNKTVPAVAEKIEHPDESVKKTWKKTGRLMLLAAAALPPVLNMYESNEKQNPAYTQTDPDRLSTTPSPEELTAIERAPYVIDDQAIYTQPSAAPERPDRSESAPAPAPEVTAEFDSDQAERFKLMSEAADGEVMDFPVPASEQDERVSSEQQATPEQPTVPEAEAKPDLSSLTNFFERPALFHTFVPGSAVDTVSEAVWEAWKKNADNQGLESPLSKSEFLSAMYKEIHKLESQPEVHKDLTEAMGIGSGNIHKVFDNETINLAPLLHKVKTAVKANYV